jgi:hypothetical protein
MPLTSERSEVGGIAVAGSTGTATTAAAAVNASRPTGYM